MYRNPIHVGDMLYHDRQKVIGWVVKEDEQQKFRWYVEWSDGDYGPISEEALLWYRDKARAFAKQNGL